VNVAVGRKLAENLRMKIYRKKFSAGFIKSVPGLALARVAALDDRGRLVGDDPAGKIVARQLPGGHEARAVGGRVVAGHFRGVAQAT
jgi:hypothetical protein